MFNIVEYEKIMNDKNCVFVDVRSPKEFNEATIKGAINIPVLLDDERAEVGTLYKKVSVEAARQRGIELISKRLPFIFSEFQKLYCEERKKVVVFCARGGMRSGSIHGLLYSLGLHVYKLKGGYKGYRQYINDNFKDVCKDVKYIILYGKTGVGKTEYLKALKEEGYDVLDLEGAANHRGSLLGSVSLGPCNTQKKFESEVFHTLKDRKSNIVFTEGESKRIGRIIILDEIWNGMMEGTKICIDDSLENRSKILIKEYIKDEEGIKELLDAVDKIKKYKNEKIVEEYKDLILDKKYKEVCERLMVEYYDPLYTNSMKVRNFQETIISESKEKTLERLREIFENKKKMEETYGEKCE